MAQAPAERKASVLTVKDPNDGKRLSSGSVSTAPKDIWTELAERQDDDASAPESKREATLVVIGPRQSGKSTLVQMYTNQSKTTTEDAPPATLSIDYRFVKSTAGGVSESQDLLNIWEIGGGKALVKLLEIPLSLEALPRTMIIITLDLSKPARLVNDANYWLGVVRSHMARFKDQSPEAFQRVQAEAAQRFGDHKEKSVVDVIPVPVMLVATKFDLIKDKDPEQLKVVSRTLRSIAHANGVTLLYMTPRIENLRLVLRARISKHVIKAASDKKLQPDHTKPIYAVAGADSFEQIGDPAGKQSSSNTVQPWSLAYARTFPPTDEDKEEESTISDVRLAPETAVDNILVMKEEELKRFSRDMQTKRRMSGVEIKMTR